MNRLTIFILLFGVAVQTTPHLALAQTSPKLTVSPSSLSFSSTPSGTSSAPKAITLKNSGTGTLQISAVSVGGDQASEFSATNGCSDALSANGACTISVTFRPTAEGPRAASLLIKSNVADRVITLKGTGAAPPKPTLTLSPTSMSFSSTVTGTSSETKTVSVRNTGKGTLQISTITVVGDHRTDFASTNTCGSPVAPGGDCTISVSFSPSAAGARSAQIEIKGNVATKSLSIRGTGMAPPKPVLALSSTSLTFSGTPAWSTSAERRVTLRNRGSAPLEVSTITLKGEDATEFSITNTCGAPIAPSGNCVIAVSFRPKTIGSKSAFFEIKGNVAPSSLPLLGTATAPRNHKISTTVSGSGTISPASLTVPAGNTGTFTLSPQSGYRPVVTGCNGTLRSEGATIKYVTGVITAPCSVNATFEVDTPFSAEPKLLSDLEPLFQQTCGETGLGRSLQHVVVNDFDNDGRKDLLLNIWCSPVTAGAEFTGPTPSRAYIFKQDYSGNFTERTSEYFGATPVDLGGVGEYYVLEDFNNDGYKDVIYAVQREDARRINSPPTNQYAFNVALMSKGNGLYSASTWGAAAWHSQLVLAANASGEFDVIETSFSQGPQGWRWLDGWIKAPGYEWVSSQGAQFLAPSTAEKGSEFAISATSGSLVGVEARKYSADGWVKMGEFGYPGYSGQKLCCGNAAPSGAALVSIDGKDYVDPSFGFFCEMKRTPESQSEVITDLNAQEIVGGYYGQLLIYGQTELIGTDKLFSFSVDSTGQLKRNTLTIRNELTRNLEPNRMACPDLNADGYQDILLYAAPTKRPRLPVIYVNDGTGDFDRVKDAALPLAPSGPGIYNYVIEDVDGDGIRDLLYFPISGEKGKPIKIRIHRGVRAINKSDVM